MSVDPIVEPTDLPSLGAVRLLDARGQRAFDAGHARGAVRIPIEQWEPKARSNASAFDDTQYWEREIAALGVGTNDAVVVYDDGRMIEASRAWLILQYVGVDARILNGGWPSIEGDGRSHQVEPHDESGNFHAQRNAGPVHLIGRSELKEKLNGDVGVLDVRTLAEFEGEDLRQNPRGGHLPGSSFVPHARLLDGGRFRRADELRKLLADAGVEDGAQLVTLCDAGGRAALAAVAALRAGHKNVHVYYPSFSDWARDQSCPVEQSGSTNIGRLSA